MTFISINHLNLCLITFILSIFQLKSKTISTNISLHSNHIETTITVPNQKGITRYFALSLNLTSDYTILDDVYIYSKSFDPSAERDSIPVERDSSLLICREAVFPIHLSNNNDINLFNFRFYNCPTRIISSSLISFGLGRKFKDYKYSLVHQLKEQNLISTHQFTIDLNSPGETKGQIYFGEPPQNIKDKYKQNQILKCSTNLSNNWSCPLSKVIISNKDNINEDNIDPIYEIDLVQHVIVFDAINYQYRLPKKYLTILEDVVLKKHVKNGQCHFKFNQNFNDIGYYECNCNAINDFPDLIFVINNGWKMMKINIENMFTQFETSDGSGDACELEIRLSDNENEWGFGAMFMKSVLSEFDYDLDEVRIYSRWVYNYKSGMIKLSLLVGITLLMGCNIILLVMLYKENITKNLIKNYK